MLAGYLAFTCLCFNRVQAQSLTLKYLPGPSKNDRFLESIAGITHPSLSINGFDCERDKNCGHGLGLKQILYRVYNQRDPVYLDVYNNLLDLALKGYVPSPSRFDQMADNNRRLMARAFVALTTYVLETNKAPLDQLNRITRHPLPSHQVALTQLNEALLDTKSWGVDETMSGKDSGDAMKWATLVGTVARAMDLYLAIENAYRCYGYGEPSCGYARAADRRIYETKTLGTLLSQTGKRTVFQRFDATLKKLEWLGEEKDKIMGFGSYEVEAGNRPLKNQVAIGYGLLTHQLDRVPYSTDQPDYREWIARAFRAAGPSTAGRRQDYWSYQTDNGRRFWAEGPYYLLWTISDIIPFWHAARINRLLSTYGVDGDPFAAGSFLTVPLHWLADTVTPDGRTLPLDDGEKAPVVWAPLLRWDATYGDADLGRKFAWLSHERGYGTEPDLLPLELSIPRLPLAGESNLEPAYEVGNTSALPVGPDGEQQIVIRRDNQTGACRQTPGQRMGECHYLVLNGEGRQALERGEGHEQADQLQLLYYVDGTSYLMDSGYDKQMESVGICPFCFDIGMSLYRNYADHNVLIGLDGSGLASPEVSLLDARVVSDHTPASFNYYIRPSDGNVTILSAAVSLVMNKQAVNYDRKVLFIDGDYPYLIDLNRGTNPNTRPVSMVQRYHLNATTDAAPIGKNGDSDNHFFRWDTPNPDKQMYLFPVAVEAELRNTLQAKNVSNLTDNASEAYGSSPSPIKRMDIQDFGYGVFSVASIFQVRDRRLAEPDRPMLIWSYPDQSIGQYQGWVWPQGDGAYDIFVARSRSTGLAQKLTFSPSQANTAFPEMKLVLPEDRDFGFARIIYDEGNHTTVLAPGYSIHLVPDTTRSDNGGETPTRIDEIPSSTGEARIGEIYPDPFTAQATIPIDLPCASTVDATVFDLLGRRLVVLSSRVFPAGRHQLIVDGAQLNNGRYLVRFELHLGSGRTVVETKVITHVK